MAQYSGFSTCWLPRSVILRSRRLSRGQVATYSYDALNRLKALLYSDETITYTYDDTATSVNSKGRLSKVADGSGSTTYAYDARGRITTKSQVTGSATLTVQYGYNAAGQLASITTPGGNAIAYGYLNKVVSVTVNGTPVVTNAKYFPFGGVASWTWGNGQAYQRTYDQDGRIQSVTIAGKVRNYGFDPASRITSLTDTQGATSTPTTIGYDNLDRLTSAQGNVPGGLDLGYGYDLIGNRTTETKTSGAGPQSRAYGYDTTSNRLASLTNPAIAYSYDPAGNTTADGGATYAYSGRNRFVTVSQGGSTIASYEYNALGQRVAKTTSATTLFAYDETGHLLGEYHDTGGMNQETVWLNDTPVATLRKSGTSTDIHYVWADHLDTPRAITTSDAAATLEWSWDSDPFGTAAPQEIALAYNLRFPGQYFDSETGKHYNYFRDYDPGIGRYVESDPLGLEAGVSTYGYVGGAPTNRLDPLGLSWSNWCAFNYSDPECYNANSLPAAQPDYLPDRHPPDTCTIDCVLIGTVKSKGVEYVTEKGVDQLLTGLKQAAKGAAHHAVARVFLLYEGYHAYHCYAECHPGDPCEESKTSPDGPPYIGYPHLIRRRH